MKDAATKCVGDIETKLKTLSGMGNKVFHIYSEEDLLDVTKGLMFPCVGVVYNGINAVPEKESTARMGLSAKLVLTIMVFFRDDARSAVDEKLSVISTMDDIRGLIKGTRSPTGHYWEFQLEAPATGKKGLLAYVQRWATPVQLT